MRPRLEIAIEAESWDRIPRLAGLTERAVESCVAETGIELPDHSELSLLLCDDARIRLLNRDWRDKDEATNVLSFPSSGPEAKTILGDIAIAYETVEREALRDRKSFADHYTHMVVHGFLHLLGYDHESDEDAETMEGFERRILAGLGIADPFMPADGVLDHDT
jgi:probable rRNA maturation factor